MWNICTCSYIVYDGKKIYLDTSYYELKNKMKKRDKEIELEVSGFLISHYRMFNKDKISEYGEFGF